MSVAVIFEKAVGIFRRIFLERLDICAIGKKDVELAVIVVVENSNTSGHGFGRMGQRCLRIFQPEINRLISEVNGTAVFSRSRLCAQRNCHHEDPSCKLPKIHWPKLFRQLLFAVNGESCLSSGSAGSGLTSTYKNTVRSCVNGAVSIFIDKAQVARIQSQLHMLHATFGNVHTGESTQSSQRCS